MSQWDVALAAEDFDLLIVDESHRLNLRASQSSALLNRRFAEINEQVFGEDADHYTQLDWIIRKSRHRVLLLDVEQRVRPADLPVATLREITSRAREESRSYLLQSQMRIRAEGDYVGYVRAVLSDDPPAPQRFGDYDLRFFDDVSRMAAAIRARDADHGLARLAAGFAWKWITRTKARRHEHDIVIGDARFRWNTKATDWISSPTSIDEVGSIHTLQGYDLNYTGVIIGPDLRFDEETGRIRFDRRHYFDRMGKQNNPRLGLSWSDDDMLEFVRNIYSVLLTRGVRGTYVYVHDAALRKRLRPYFSG